MSVETGAGREIWLAPPTEHATNKHSFLIRDDAYTMTEASFGRQVRLGQPIDLGPNGSWNQEGWFGGYDQERWLDEYMYREGQLDGTDRSGKLTMWSGYRHMFGRDTNADNAMYTVAAIANKGTGENTPILVCENGNSGNAEIRELRSSGTNSVVATVLDTSINAISPLDDGKGVDLGQWLIGTNDGRIHLLRNTSGGYSRELDTGGPGVGPPIGRGGITSFNDQSYYGRGPTLWRRFLKSGTITHSAVKTMENINRIQGLTVWNNRLWFVGYTTSGQSHLFTSDGVTVASVLSFPHGFQANNTVPHYGSLYIGGIVDRTPGALSSSGQLWRYNGSSLQKVWDGQAVDQEGYGIYDLVSHDRFVVWGKHGSTATGRRAGVWFYDAEEDAIVEGPTIDMDPASPRYQCNALLSWNDTIVVAFKDAHTYGVGRDHPTTVSYVRRSADPTPRNTVNTNSEGIDTWTANTSILYEPTTITRPLTSSDFDAQLPGAHKVWLTGYLRAKIPTGTQVRVKVYVDNDTGAEQVFASDGTTDWRDIHFDVLDSTGLQSPKGVTARYELTLEVLTPADTTPEVDFIGIQFMPAETRRRQWYVRTICTDGQERLDGTANPLITRTALVNKLIEYWRDNHPIDFWEPRADGVEPDAGDAVRVTVSNLAEQSWRLSTTSSEQVSEVSFSLLEMNPNA